MDVNTLVKRAMEDIASGKATDHSALLGIFTMQGKQLNLDNHYMFAPFFKTKRPKHRTWQCARQVSKSWSIGEDSIITTGMIRCFNTLILEPRFDQRMRFNAQILAPLIKTSPLYTKLIDKRGADSVDMKTFRNGNYIMLEHSFNSPDRVRGASNVANLIVDEAQDINQDFLPIFEATTDASLDYGFVTTTGTAKTSDTLLAMRFNASSQGYWTIKCLACNHYNISSPEHHLLKMIGLNGPTCYHCGKILPIRQGFFLHAYPSRIDDHPGYHVPQIIMPMHAEIEHKWQTLLQKQREWSKVKFYNEVLGVSCDEAVRILTLDDLLRARNAYPNSLENISRIRDQYEYVVTSCDWSGGGGGFSRTAFAVLGRRYGVRDTEVLYMETMPHGLSPEQEADRAAYIFNVTRSQVFAHDYTGAGFARESIMLGRHPYMAGKIYPMAYIFRAQGNLVSYMESGSRRSYNVDKTRSLLLTMMALRSTLLTLPVFDARDGDVPQREFLNIVERAQEIDKVRITEVYLLQRVPGKYDDAAHAVNIGFIAMCDLTQMWPEFKLDPKFTISQDQIEALQGHIDIMES